MTTFTYGRSRYIVGATNSDSACKKRLPVVLNTGEGLLHQLAKVGWVNVGVGASRTALFR